jgi:uncharacterized protein
MKAKHKSKLFFLFFWIALHFGAFAQTDNKIVIGHIDTVQSKILNEPRQIWIYTPESEDSSSSAKQRYPVVYLLDGKEHFVFFVGVLKHLSYHLLCPQMIVVGITNTDRDRDLTPTRDSSYYFKSGGGKHFMSFIEKELMPYVDSKYPTEPFKMLIGHSLGGLTVMNALINHTDLFNAYIAIDPSMWWDNQKLLKQAKTVLAERKFEEKSLFLSIANTMDVSIDINKVQTDTPSLTNHFRALLNLKSYLETNKQNGLKSQCKYYSDDSHSSVTLITEYDALKFLFDYYPLKLTSTEFKDTTEAIIDKYQNHYDNVSKHLGYKVRPLETEIYSVVLSAYKNIKQERLLKLYIDYYPESFLANKTYGDFFLRIGDTSRAVLRYKKALSLDKSEELKQKLDELQILKLSAEELHIYTGEFVIAENGVTIKTFVNKNILTVSVKGEPDLELYSTKINEFKVKDVKDRMFRFEMDEEKPISIEIVSPMGKFKATLKK